MNQTCFLAPGQYRGDMFVAVDVFDHSDRGVEPIPDRGISLCDLDDGELLGLLVKSKMQGGTHLRIAKDFMTNQA